MSKKCMMSGNCTTICGTSASRICAPSVPLDPPPAAEARQEPRAAPLRGLRQTTRRTPHPLLPWTSVSVELCSQPPPALSVLCARRPSYFFTSRHLVEAVVGGCGTGPLRTLCCSCRPPTSAGVAEFSARRRDRHATDMSTTGLDQLVTQRKRDTASGPRQGKICTIMHNRDVQPPCQQLGNTYGLTKSLGP